MIVAAFISDRGDLYLPGCRASFLEHLEPGIIEQSVVINDEQHRLGMAGAVRAAWEWALETGADYLFHVEEDFLFERPIPLLDMAALLDRNPHLAQVVLKRQPWSDPEKAAGGIIEMNPDAYHDCFDGSFWWTEHETLFSMNPSLIARRTLELEWDVANPGGVERAVTDACHDKGLKFAYYGRKSYRPRCAHVGYQRSAGYRW